MSQVVGTMIELLAAIPSIIYGMWGLFVFAPIMATYVQPFLSKYLGFLPLFTGPRWASACSPPVSSWPS